MSDIQVFNNVIFGELPVIQIEGKEFFGATEAAKALSFGNPYSAIPNHVEEDDLMDREVIDRLGRKQTKKFVNESGLYSLIFGAAKQGNNLEIQARAKMFKRWVTGEILPTIRKHGAYMTDDVLEKTLNDPDYIIGVISALKDEKQKRLAAEQTIQKQKPKVLFADAVETSKASILIGELAKLLKQNGVAIGQKRLFDWLRDNGYLIKRMGDEYNNPTQKSMELGLFEIKKSTITNPDGSVRVTKTSKVTGKGQIYFINKFIKGE